MSRLRLNNLRGKRSPRVVGPAELDDLRSAYIGVADAMQQCEEQLADVSSSASDASLGAHALADRLVAASNSVVSLTSVAFRRLEQAAVALLGEPRRKGEDLMPYVRRIGEVMGSVPTMLAMQRRNGVVFDIGAVIAADTGEKAEGEQR